MKKTFNGTFVCWNDSRIRECCFEQTVVKRKCGNKLDENGWNPNVKWNEKNHGRNSVKFKIFLKVTW
jgi:hypothetical protein